MSTKPKYELHSITEDYADFTPEECEKLKADLKANGLKVPILLWNNRIVDGRHRYEVCCKLGITPRFDTITLGGKSEQEMRDHVASLNQFRRSRTKPLTNAEKDARVKAELLKDPSRSNRAIAAAAGVSDPMVGKVRKRLESTAKVSQLPKTVGKDGKIRTATPKRPSSKRNRPTRWWPNAIKELREAHRNGRINDSDAENLAILDHSMQLGAMRARNFSKLGVGAGRLIIDVEPEDVDADKKDDTVGANPALVVEPERVAEPPAAKVQPCAFNQTLHDQLQPHLEALFVEGTQNGTVAYHVTLLERVLLAWGLVAERSRTKDPEKYGDKLRAKAAREVNKSLAESTDETVKQ